MLTEYQTRTKLERRERLSAKIELADADANTAGGEHEDEESILSSETFVSVEDESPRSKKF